MMNRVKGIIRTHLTDRLGWIFLPWIILSSSFACNLIIAGLSGEEFYTGGLASIYVYMTILGIMIVAQTYPFIIGFGARRKDYFLGTAATIAIVSAVFTLMLCVLAVIEVQSGGWGVNLHFFNLPYLSEGSAIERIWIQFSLMTNLVFIGFFFSCIYRKFGRNGMFLFFVALSVVLSFSTYFITIANGWDEIFNWLSGISAVHLATGLFVLTLVYLGLSYGLLRRATV
ncbi:hypothetical protein [Cohnella silvisoli]|uniref:ABC transporter permease n=1 Tax=Cohnella silvisoli TaxID=2873699 RepID=A0ABV1KX89_9BACL|nr:hypothetical protein [Cohnella silvisoli]MCD9024124.1 hypothetical protein [Cohnella silvisoli]